MAETNPRDERTLLEFALEAKASGMSKQAFLDSFRQRFGFGAEGLDLEAMTVGQAKAESARREQLRQAEVEYAEAGRAFDRPAEIPIPTPEPVQPIAPEPVRLAAQVPPPVPMPEAPAPPTPFQTPEAARAEELAEQVRQRLDIPGLMEEGPTTWGEALGYPTRFAGRAVGTAAGAVKGVGEELKALAVMGESGVVKAFEEEVARIEDPVREALPAATLAREELAEIATGMHELGRFFLGGGESPEEREALEKEGLSAVFGESFERGLSMGEALVAGGIGGTAAVAANPLDAIRNTPVNAAMTMLGPAFKAVRLGGATAAGTKASQWAIDTAVAALDKVDPNHFARLAVKDKVSLLRQWVSDPNRSSSATTEEMLREVTELARRKEAEIKGLGELAARQTLRLEEVPRSKAEHPAVTLVREDLAEIAMGMHPEFAFSPTPAIGGIDEFGALVELPLKEEPGFWKPGPKKPGIEGEPPSVSFEDLRFLRGGFQMEAAKLPPIPESLEGLVGKIEELTGGDESSARRALQRVLGAADPSIFRSKKLRAKVLADLVHDLKKGTLGPLARRRLVKELESRLAKGMDRDLVLSIPGVDRPFSVMQSAQSAISVDAKLRKAVLAEAVQSLVSDKALEAGKAARKQAVAKHLDIDGKGSADPEEAARFIAEGGELSPILRADPAIMSAYLRTGPAGTQQKRAIQHLSRYEPLSPDARQYLRIGGTKPFWVHRDTNNAVLHLLRTEKSLGGGGVWDRLQRAVKTNITARNPVSHINNVSANAVLQAIRTGRFTEPVDVGLRAHKFAVWKKKPEAVSEADARMFEDLVAGGVADSNVVIQDLGESMSGLEAALAYARGARDAGVLSRFNRGMERLYGQEDGWFKVHEGSRVYEEVAGLVDQLKDAEWLDLIVGPNQKVRLTKGPGGIVGPTGVLTEDKLGRLFGRAAAHHANKLFFDFGSKPKLVSWMADTPVSVASPFVTWGIKALELPLQSFRRTPIIKTNSQSINRQMLGQSAQAAVRRQAMLQAARDELEGMPEEARRMMRWGTRDAATYALNLLTNPEYIGVQSTGPLNFGSAWDMPLRVIGEWQFDEEVGEEAAKVLIDREKFDQLSPAQRKQKAALADMWARLEGGEGFGLPDLLNFIGTAGGPIDEAWRAALESDELDKGRLFRSFFPLVMSGAAAKGVDVGFGLMDPANLITSRRWSIPDVITGDPGETPLEWVIRKVTGKGWRPVNAAKQRDRYLTPIQRAWEKTLLPPIQARMDVAEKRGDTAAAQAALEELNATRDSIIKAMRRMEAHQNEALQGMGVHGVGGRVDK